MSKRSKNKISIDGDGSLGSNPFAGLDAGLDAGSLPNKPAPVKAPPSVEVKKKPIKPKGRVELRREKAGRGGKTVTTLREFPTHIPLSELDKLTFELKKTCACGGTLKGRAIELQGDVRDRVMAELTKRGYQPVRAGG
jgi:translation initiation factor 1